MNYQWVSMTKQQMRNATGVRGYIGSRLYANQRTPQHVQNLVIREYCQRNGIVYLLSATEYAMPGCYMMLSQVLDELPELSGICIYSLFMLPEDKQARADIYLRFMETGRTLHSAVENLSVSNKDDVQRIEDFWRVHQTLPHCWQG